jgi:DNA-directed RNA polymerase delta subunit
MHVNNACIAKWPYLQGNKMSFVFLFTTIMKALQAFKKRKNNKGDTAIVQVYLMLTENNRFFEMACRAYIIVAFELFVKFSSL